MSAHYDREVDIVELSFESGRAVWDASERLPRELVDALPAPGASTTAA